VALITGANSGIGLEAARALAANGAKVILACRNSEKAEAAAEEIATTVPDAQLEIIQLDLADLSSIAAAIAQVQAGEPRLDLLINNAGVMGIAQSATADGFEMQFGTNHLGHFALTAGLIGKLNEADAGRVVTISSNAHKFGRMRPDDLMGEKRYGRWRQYGLSKLSNLLFSYELQQRLAAAGESTAALAAHPGTSRTGLADDAGWTVKILGPLMYPLSHDAAEGALPTLRAAVDPLAEGGTYYGPTGRGGFTGPPDVVESSKASHNTADAQFLWDKSEELTASTFAI
jgi:NAD(P)-dependent dehydrogenase (short-subunit alcohol dehydrogenase family)